MSAHAWPEPAYVVRTRRLEARCYERADVDAVHDAIVTHAEALRPYMPWIREEPIERARRAATLRGFRGAFDAGTNFIYGVWDRASRRFVGGTGLHPRSGAGVLEIGYWIVPDRWGEGLATEVAAAMTRVGFERMGARRMELRIAPDNAASLRVAQKLGYVREGVLRSIGEDAREEAIDLAVFGLLGSELSSSPAASVALELEGFA